MATRDLRASISAAPSLAPATRTASANGAGVDLRGYDSAVVVVHTGTITDGTHTIAVEESSDNTTFTAVADADLLGTEPAIGAPDDDKVYEVGYRGGKRYLRAIVTVSGATSGGAYGATVVRGHAHLTPA